MQIELTKQEIELLDIALDLWENEPQTIGLTSSMLGAMLFTGKRTKQEIEAAVRAEQEEARNESYKRRSRAIMIRVKLVQALNRESEHEPA